MGRGRPQRANVRTAALLGLLALVVVMAGHDHTQVAAQDLSFTVTTLQDVSSAEFSTWISLLATSLLPPSTPGAFLGTVPADAVEATCQAVEAGQLSFDTQVTILGNTERHQIQIQNIGGCDASSASPQGVELVYIDETGATTAVICDENAQNLGCQIYSTGDDVTQYYQGAMSNTVATPGGGGGGRRKLLDAGCFVAGAVTGTVVATVGAAKMCTATGTFYLLCVGGASVVGFIGGALTGCNVMASASCFPGEALVMLRSRTYKHMFELQIGDEVATWGENGRIRFDSIYAFGHVDGASNGLYFGITLVKKLNTDIQGSNATIDIRKQNLLLSSGHFVPTLSGKGKVVYKRALDLNVGDQMWAMLSYEEDELSLFTVEAILMSANKGMYNPFTLGGSIIVDGVVASTHSDWFLDNAFDNMGLDTHWLPIVYQVVLLPIRLIYRTLSITQYTRLYSYIDENLDIPTFGTKHGGFIASIWVGISLLLGAALIFQNTISKGMKKSKKGAPSSPLITRGANN
ncbi:hypothetical protein L7F22_029192 [Adiantum nelumboides]|nr:hypothetical protein [Adiantum nelumboides]